MYGKSYSRHSFVERDRRLAMLRSRLSLASCSRNQAEITRLTREIKRAGQSLY